MFVIIYQIFSVKGFIAVVDRQRYGYQVVVICFTLSIMHNYACFDRTLSLHAFLQIWYWWPDLFYWKNIKKQNQTEVITFFAQ